MVIIIRKQKNSPVPMTAITRLFAKDFIQFRCHLL
jgi:hypothetical protein